MGKENQKQQSDIILYTTPEGDIKIDVFYKNETVWLTQKKMAELFDVEVNTINYHLKEIFKSNELNENSVIRKIRITAKDAKNYLNEKELRELNRIVSMYLDYAELQAGRQVPMKMADWIKKLDAFIQFNEYEILDNPGKVSAKVAKELAEKEFEKFRIVQDRQFESDFDKETKKLLK